MKREMKHWSRPQLVALGRGRAEESVLLGCKYTELSGPVANGCRNDASLQGACQSQNLKS